MKPPKLDCYDYIRRTYGVPAYIGVTVDVGEHTGVIVAATSSLNYLHIRRDDGRTDVYHPTDGVVYHVVGAEVEGPHAD